MEAMRYRDELNIGELPETRESETSVAVSDWRVRLPVLESVGVSARQLRLPDAPSLLAMLGTDDVARFISPPPISVEGFQRFICWTAREQAGGRSLSFGIVPQGYDTAIGIVHVRALEASFASAEWSFGIGSPFWGTGVFVQGATAVVEFLLDFVGVQRLEARAPVDNGRANGVLRKLGAAPEGLLRRSFYRNGQYVDQVLWTIIGDEWRQAKAVWGSRIH